MAEEPTSPAAEPAEGGSTEPESNPSKTYSQEELDRIVAQRVQKSKAQFKDYDEYKQAAQRLAELEESRKTEAERLLGQLDKYKTEAQQATEREQQAIARANSMLVRSAVVREAARANAVDPDDVYALADAHGLLSGVQIGDDGQVAGVDAAVKQLLDDRPHLVGRPSGGFDGGARQNAPVANSRADLNAQIRKAAGFA